MAATTTTPDEAEPGSLTILEHLQEARRRMIICAVATGLGLIVGAVFATTVIGWMKDPAESRVEDFQLIFTSPLEYWSTYFKVMLLISITLAMPVFVWQLLAFVGPGLTSNEKKWAYPIVLGASAMFIMGMAFGYFIGLPPALNFLLDAGNVAQPLISVDKYVDFVTRFLLVTGLVFETPLIIMGLAKVGVVTSRKLFSWWKFALVGAFIIAAIVTPSIDPITQIVYAVPMIVFYFFGAVLAMLVEKTSIIPHR